MSTPEQRIRDFYGFDFPEDFFRFREFLAELPHGLQAGPLELNPAFPFDVANGKRAKDYPKRPHWQDRYYNDLPEFVTLFYGGMGGLHRGYFFDAPGELEPVVASYYNSDTFEHTLPGDDIFATVRYLVEEAEEDLLELMEEEEGEADSARKSLGQVETVRNTLARYWGKDRPEIGYDYLDEYDDLTRKPTAKTRSQVGIVVPRRKYKKLSVDLAAEGSIELEGREAELAALIDEAMGLLRKGYPGSALKLGHDLWCFTRPFPQVYDLLDAAYAALGREPLRKFLAEAKAFRAMCEKAWQ